MMERGLIGVIFKEVWMARNFCNNLSAVEFVYKFQNDASRLAQQVNVPTENILGLAAEESQYGAGRIATTINNYFSMHAPAPLQIGEEPAQGNPSVKNGQVQLFLSKRTILYCEIWLFHSQPVRSSAVRKSIGPREF